MLSRILVVRGAGLSKAKSRRFAALIGQDLLEVLGRFKDSRSDFRGLYTI